MNYEKAHSEVSDRQNIRRRAVTQIGRYLQTPEESILRSYQMDVMSAVHDSLKDGKRGGYISLPPGSGKTPLALELISAINPEGKTVIVSPTRPILEQTRDKAEELTPDLEIGNYYSQEKDLSGRIINTTYTSLHRLIETGKLNSNEIDLIIADEAHMALGEVRHTTFSKLPHALMIGLTATPFFQQLEGYKSRKMIEGDESWLELFHNQMYEMSLEEAMERHILVPLDIHLLKTETTIGNVGLKHGDYIPSDMEIYLNQVGRNNLIVALLAGIDSLPEGVELQPDLKSQIADLHEQIKGKQTMIFGDSIRHVTTITDMLGEAGIKAATIHNRIPSEERTAILENQRNGITQVLTGVDMLRLGIDIPDTAVGIYAAPTRSGIVAVQELGRILRPDSASGKDHATAIQLIDDYQFKEQAPILISDLFDPSYVLRGSQLGKESNQSSPVRLFSEDIHTFDSIEIHSSLEKYYSRFLLKKRLSGASIMEAHNILEEQVSQISDKNPEASFKDLMEKLAEQVPYFVRKETQAKIHEALASIDSNVAQAARRVSLFLNVKTVLAAIAPFETGESDTDEDLLQVAVAIYLEKLDTLPKQYNDSMTMHRQIQTGLINHVSKELNVPKTVIADMDYRSMLAEIDDTVYDYPLGMSDFTLRDLARSLNGKYGINEKTAVALIRYRHSVIEAALKPAENITEQEVFPGFLADDISKAMDTLKPIQKDVLTKRFGLGSEEEKTLENVGKDHNLTKERTRQIESLALRHLRHPSRAKFLKNYLN